MEKPRARIKQVPEDFVVDEEPAYAASGAGDHLFVRIEKRNLTTHDAVNALADALGVRARDVGVPGLKDKVAVTTQWLSFQANPGTDVEKRLEAFSFPGIRVLESARHNNKLRTGHLARNRFKIRLRDVDEARLGEVTETLLALETSGVPNAYGLQRFGRHGDNVERALGFLSGKERGPRDLRAKKFLFSSLQSHVFNRVLEARQADGKWNVPVLGDLLKLETGGMFVCTDVQTDTARARAGELGPTGPMFGVKMRGPEHDAAALEERILVETLGADFDYGRTKPYGEGTRRPLVLRVAEMRVTQEGKSGEQRANLLVEFVLPKGAYATTVLACAVAAEEGSRESSSEESGSDGETESESAQ